MSTLFRDLRFGLRVMLKTPGLTALLLITLSIGIGATTGIFSVVDAVMFRPLSVFEPDRLVRLFTVPFTTWSFAAYLDYRDQATAFSGLAAYSSMAMDLSREAHIPERVSGSIVTGNYFQIMGVQPALGRLLTREDDGPPGQAAVVVLSHAFWSERYSADPDAVGWTVRINGTSFTVVGVAPRTFHGCDLESFPDLWIPASMAPAVMTDWATLRPFERRGFMWLDVVGRLKPEVSLAEARAEVGLLAGRLARAATGASKIQWVKLEPAGEVLLGFEVESGDRALLMSRLLLGVVALVLLLACVDAAGLLLVRAERRGREIAIRGALGATPACIVRQLLVESLLTVAFASAGGLLLASWTISLVRGLAPPGFPIPLEAVTGPGDERVLLFTLAVSAVAGLLFGVAPALHAARAAILPRLRSATAEPLLRRLRFSLRDALVLLQVSLAAILLIGAGLLIRTLRHAGSVDPGFPTEGRLVASIAPGMHKYGQEEGRAFYQQLLEAIRSQPGVRSASLASSVPVSPRGMHTSVEPEGQTLEPEQVPIVPLTVVTPGYFSTLGVSILRGRDFDASDHGASAPVAIVNEAFARRFWPGQEAVGRRIMNLGNGGSLVVGVIRTTKILSVREEPEPAVSVPLSQFYAPAMTLLVHADGDPRALLSPITAAVRTLDPDLPLFDIQTLHDRLATALAQERLLAVMLGAFAGISFVLAIAGLYGVTSYTTELRFREFGIRAALGATRRQVLFEALRGAVPVLGAGILLGLFGAMFLTRFFKALFFGVGPFDPMTFAGIALLLGGVTLLAAVAAARRATTVDPLTCMRAE